MRRSGWERPAHELLPEPEVAGLLALMLLQESRRAARTSLTGELVLLENQDRALWHGEQIAEGVALVSWLHVPSLRHLHPPGGHRRRCTLSHPPPR